MNNLTTTEDEILNIEGASKLTGYSKSTLYVKSSKKEIPVCNTGKKLFFFRSQLIEWVKSYKKEAELQNNKRA